MSENEKVLTDEEIGHYTGIWARADGEMDRVCISLLRRIMATIAADRKRIAGYEQAFDDQHAMIEDKNKQIAAADKVITAYENMDANTGVPIEIAKAYRKEYPT